MYGKTPHETALAVDGGHRAAFVQGLVDLAVYLTTHPDVPVPPSGDICYVVLHGDDQARRAEVDRIAAALGTTASTAGSEHYQAVRRFGPIRYEALAVSDAGAPAWEALTSYRGCVQPERTVTCTTSI